MFVKFPSILRNRNWSKTGLLAAALLASPAVWAAGPPAKSSLSEPLVFTLVVLMLLLLLVIALLANVLLGTVKFQQENEKKATKLGSAAALIGGLMLLPALASAQTTPAAAPAAEAVNYGGMSATTFYLVIGVIVIEIVTILFMLVQLKAILAKEKARKVAEAVAAGAVVKPEVSLWDRINSFRPQEQEADLDLGHNYDGIRELDNRLPPWWLWGFYVTIVAAGIYLWRYHVVHTAPLSAEEFEISMKVAERQQAEYLKTAANKVDENTVTLLTAGADISAGKAIFDANCVACHGNAGQGGVGPNLTDDYWLHGGGIKDIFKTVKYGWQDKGMKSWKEDFTASQMAQVSSYVHTLHGTNPANPKAPQGELYKEGAAPADTTKAAGTAAPAADTTVKK